MASQSQAMSRHPLYYLPSVTFAVEDVLFQVPRYKLEAHSKVFRDLFTLPVGEGLSAEGSGDDNPIKLESIKSADFEIFLGYLYPMSKLTPQGHEEWISVLKLSTMWDFVGIQRRALREVSATLESKTPLELIALANEYKVPRWLLDAYSALVKQREVLGQQEIDALGLETAFRLLQIREGTYRCAARASYGNGRNFSGLENTIVHVFYQQLKDAGFCGSEDEVPEEISLLDE
ncbi:hypothetical protein FIBSPDRAFT_838962 [Athelia psychrophila]|uniref:BTB domain-containing protein n=1 Tax=Athelia psychrophila TaxID=1759441 RepID=A0A165YVB6_9AGAM|nr:hypothetical protein FIBSPDRAFT_838962 [Fibularhizoctonia sp. CBS 109695]